jgi:hypothetical protein
MVNVLSVVFLCLACWMLIAPVIGTLSALLHRVQHGYFERGSFETFAMRLLLNPALATLFYWLSKFVLTL